MGMVNTYTYKNVTWIDLANPTRDEVRDIVKKYDVDPIAAEELLLPTMHSRVERYNDFIHFTLHFPAWKHSHKETSQELDIVVGKNVLITARYDSIDALYKFSKMFEVNTVLDHNNIIGEHAGYALYYMVQELYKSLSDELDSVRDSLQEIEKKTFKGQEQEMVFKISNTSRGLLLFKHTTALHRETLESFAIVSKQFFGQDFSKHVEAMMGEYSRIEKNVHSLSELLAEIRQTNNSLLETKQNHIMLVFTSVTIISSFLNIMASWFLIDSPDSPIRHNPHEFWLAGLTLLTVGLFLAAIMKSKKWL